MGDGVKMKEKRDRKGEKGKEEYEIKFDGRMGKENILERGKGVLTREREGEGGRLWEKRKG